MVSFGSTGPSHPYLFADYCIVFLEASLDNFTKLRNILQAYVEASGQWVNLEVIYIFLVKVVTRRKERSTG